MIFIYKSSIVFTKDIFYFLIISLSIKQADNPKSNKIEIFNFWFLYIYFFSISIFGILKKLFYFSNILFRIFYRFFYNLFMILK